MKAEQPTLGELNAKYFWDHRPSAILSAEEYERYLRDSPFKFRELVSHPEEGVKE